MRCKFLLYCTKNGEWNKHFMFSIKLHYKIFSNWNTSKFIGNHNCFMPSTKHNGICYKYLTTNLILYTPLPTEKSNENLVHLKKYIHCMKEKVGYILFTMYYGSLQVLSTLYVCTYVRTYIHTYNPHRNSLFSSEDITKPVGAWTDWSWYLGEWDKE